VRFAEKAAIATVNSRNTFLGDDALLNTIGICNTATGSGALVSNTTGVSNTANGATALFRNTTGNNNTANGGGALFYNTTGGNNTANGFYALKNNTTGNSSIALGYNGGKNLTTGSNNIDIGNLKLLARPNTIRIGTAGIHANTFISGISGTAVVGDTVVVDGNGKLGTIASSQRFKDEIKPMEQVSEAILSLKPVTFRYKEKIDPKRTPQFGLVAEEVEKVNPDLVVRDADGKPYTVRYEAVNAMLLNEFLKEHRKVQELKSTVTKQEGIIAQQQRDFQATAAHQQKQIEALTAGLQKVSAQVEMSKPESQMVANNQ
jgi:hypothetical protein